MDAERCWDLNYHWGAVVCFESWREAEQFQFGDDVSSFAARVELDEQFKEDDGQGVDVDLVVVGLGRHLLGTHVEPSADLIRVVFARRLRRLLLGCCWDQTHRLQSLAVPAVSFGHHVLD